MGEQSKLPDESMPKHDDKSEEEMNVDHVEDAEESETEEEYKALDNQLNALSKALDTMEQKNDDIFEQLQQLLESNREIRNQMDQEPKN